MMLNLFTNTTAARIRKPKAHRAILSLEGLEERTVMSHMMAAPVQPAAQVAVTPKVTTSLPLTFTGLNTLQVARDAAGAVTSVSGTAIANLAGHTVTTPFTLTPTTTAGTVSILDLRLDPIHLNLLGLKVDTSAICLKITAQSGPGNLLGNLLTDVANLLNPNAGTAALTNILNGTLSSPKAAATPSVTGTTAGATNVLNLSVGPVNLSLLGLNVKLDNCNNGPVTVSVTAQPGPGNLLGNLISSLSHLLDNPGNTVGGILSHLGQISGIVRNARVV